MSEQESNKSQNNGPRCSVMLVDDSSFVRGVLKRTLLKDGAIEIVAEAANGKIALEKLQNIKPDVILLDIEMPEMDGITALKEILHLYPDKKIIMVSALTKGNAAISIKALAMGASDYIAKPTSDTDKRQFGIELIAKIKALAHITDEEVVTDTKKEDTKQVKQADIPSPPVIKHKKKDTLLGEPKALAIGCSTGGPQALAHLFKELNGKITNIPIFITQHMPPHFTTFLAENIDKTSETECYEAKDGMDVMPGTIYIAPGDFHMVIEAKVLGCNVIKLNQEPPKNFCRPSVDLMLRSLSKIYGKDVLTVILTGMGSDGLEGVRDISNNGGRILIQDKKTSVVWGMPGAVAEEGLQDEILPLNGLAPRILEICKSL